MDTDDLSPVPEEVKITFEMAVRVAAVLKKAVELLRGFADLDAAYCEEMARYLNHRGVILVGDQPPIPGPSPLPNPPLPPVNP